MAFFDASNPNLYIAIALSVVNGVMLCFCGYKFLHVLQLSGYKFRATKFGLRTPTLNTLVELRFFPL